MYKSVKRILASVLAISNIGVGLVYADETIVDLAENSSIEDIVEYAEIENTITEDEYGNVVIEDLGVQLDGLYTEIGDKLNIDSIFVKILHILAGGKAIYDEKLPDIYSDITIESVKGSFDILGATCEYSSKADWILCSDETISRPSKYYVPDAAYSVATDIVKIMNRRYNCDRGVMQDYFDDLAIEVKTQILFCEAVLEYTGNDEETVNSLYKIYEKIIYDKEANENVIEVDESGNFYFKDKFLQIVKSNGITDDGAINNLAIIFSFDSKLAASKDLDEIQESYVYPYEYGYQSRENMMLAAMSVVGKVRYIWGGGHLLNEGIQGINPSWEAFCSMYEEDEQGNLKCIKPSNSWCPVHGSVTDNENGCLLKSDDITSIEEYVEYLNETVGTSVTFEVDKYSEILSGVDLVHGVSAHRLDGLDCSGFTSWLYTQVSDKTFDSGARGFIGQAGIKSLKFGSNLLPGDVFSWGEHIVAIVGRVRDGSKSYVSVESTPNMVKFGVVYYAGASTADIAYGIQIANEANKLIGNLPEDESAHIYNMSACVYTADEDASEQEQSWNGYHEIGRLSAAFIDEKTVISEYGKTMSDMNAVEIIQHTIDNLPYRYLSGIETYTGEMFNTEVAKENMVSITEASSVSENLADNYIGNQEVIEEDFEILDNVIE